MEAWKENQDLAALRQLMAEQDRGQQAAELDRLLQQMDSMERQLWAVSQELRAVKEQLEASGPMKPEQRFVSGLVQKLEGRLDSLRERMDAMRAHMADWAKNTLEQFKQAGVSALDKAMLSDFAAVPPDTRGYDTMRVALRDISAFAHGASPLFDPLPEKALQAERELEQVRKEAEAKERRPARAEKPTDGKEPTAGTLAAAARALSKKQKSQEAEMGGEQLSLDMLMQPEPPQEPEAQETPTGQPTVSYDLGYGHAGSGLNVWNRLETVNGDYKTIAHIYPNRDIVFFDANLPEEVKEQIRQVAATSEMTVSATQDAPVFSTPPQRTEPVQEENRAPWWEEYNHIRETQPDTLVLYQVGDFYEMYGEDAKVAAPLLGIGLHTRNIPDVGRVEFCGIPVEKLNRSVSRLREQRHDVTVAGMDEDTGKRRIRVMLSIQNEQADTRAEDYRLLSRLKADCEYFLGAGQGAEKHLWAGSVSAQIAKMRELYALLPEKPEWITEQDIDRYEQRMAGYGRATDVPAPAADAPADGSALYRDALALTDRALRENVVYGYLRDRDTDYDSAREELSVAIDEYMENLEDQRPALVQAYHTLPLFRDWLLEDLLERHYQDVNIDPRDSVEKHMGEPDAPAWIRSSTTEPAQVRPEQDAPTDEPAALVEQAEPSEDTGVGTPQAEEAQEPSLTPNVEEYLNLKAQHPDKIISASGWVIICCSTARMQRPPRPLWAPRS